MEGSNKYESKYSKSERWSNEKHLEFLKSMEASFVRTHLSSNANIIANNSYINKDYNLHHRRCHDLPSPHRHKSYQSVSESESESESTSSSSDLDSTSPSTATATATATATGTSTIRRSIKDIVGPSRRRIDRRKKRKFSSQTPKDDQDQVVPIAPN